MVEPVLEFAHGLHGAPSVLIVSMKTSHFHGAVQGSESGGGGGGDGWSSGDGMRHLCLLGVIMMGQQWRESGWRTVLVRVDEG